ncbi:MULTISPECIES: hypothetical protein [unclassified Novosphingobium]|uniref:hypothetical protein n=1 Tax=unclassified Novosphingobium TaxID=2644732 RepID=UPI0002E0AB46|nr:MULTISPECIES: hypothetical protein [unclassified Novosphingobium]GFM30073.1 uncharacterized protein PY1_contig-08-652 [Novosphingobium sp. PY1]
MSIRENLRRGRSHIITAIVLIVAGALVVHIEDRNLQRESGEPVPDHAAAVQDAATTPGGAQD